MRHELTDSELETYSRQVVLSDIGFDGQVRLKNFKVCIYMHLPHFRNI